jgi:filamentous hemagglutinin
METADHVQTGSWGRSKAAQAYRQKQADLIAQGKIRESVQMDIDDIRSKFGNKYNDHIQEMLDAFGDEF